MAFLTGVAATAFGKHPGSDAPSLMETAARAAIADAGLPGRPWTVSSAAMPRPFRT